MFRISIVILLRTDSLKKKSEKLKRRTRKLMKRMKFSSDQAG
jgi:hypothetical protein